MKLAIAGYGNLGKSLEKEIESSKDFSLTAIYSRRNIDNKKYRPLSKIGQDSDFDALMIALGSYGEAREYAPLFAQFDTVDSFDTHAVMSQYKKELTDLNRNRLAVIGAGWDPGLLSVIRGAASLDNTPVTVWGKGISQGHSNAIRSIKGVIDAVQFTVPKSDFQTLLNNGETNGAKLHDRICYVACVESDKKDVKRQIINMPNYFADYDTTVRFVTPAEVRRLKTQTSHRGQVYCKGKGYTVNASIELDCNTDLTAQIMLTYAKALPRLKQDGYFGALDVFDIPLKYVANTSLI